MASKLFVGNLPQSVTDAHLSEFAINAGFRVASAVVIRDKLTGTHRGDLALSSWQKAKTSNEPLPV